MDTGTTNSLSDVDQRFRYWCGASPCRWDVVAGSVKRVPTWHANDYGLSLEGTPAGIATDTTDSPVCILIALTADAEETAQLTLSVDLGRDGTIDGEKPVSVTGFKTVRTVFKVASGNYGGLRVTLTKKGPGRAIVSRILGEPIMDCAGQTLPVKDRPLGAVCSLDGHCRSGVCCNGLCAGCCRSPNSSCPRGGTCAQAPVVSEMDASTSDASAMDASAKDASVPDASIKDASSKDASSASTSQGDASSPPEDAAPYQCNPGLGVQDTREECLSGRDCLSGVCEGTRTDDTRPGKRLLGGRCK
jgi:hypothetical protein